MKNQKGFSLLEVLIVIGIIAVIAAISMIGYTKVMKTARDKMAQTRLSVIAEAQSRFRLALGRGRYATACELAQTTSNTGEKLIPETIAKFDESCNPVLIGEWKIEDDLGNDTTNASLRNNFLIRLKKDDGGVVSLPSDSDDKGDPKGGGDGSDKVYCIAEDGVLRSGSGGCDRSSEAVE